MEELELIEKYTPLIYKIAKKFYSIEMEDLYQAGCIGLIKAKRKYDKSLNTSFIDYASKYIFGEMYELINKSRDIKLNKYYLKLFKQIKLAEKELFNILSRSPLLGEISDYLNIEENIIYEVITLTTKMLSLDAEYQTSEGKVALKESLGKTEDYENQILINDSINRLDPLEQDVIKIRYFEDLTQMETAKVLGISQVKVSRIEQKGKQKIKEYIAV